MGPSVGDLFFTSEPQLRETIKEYKGRSVSFHCEDPQVLELHKGEQTHELKRPAQAEVFATTLALELIEEHFEWNIVKIIIDQQILL